MSIEIPQSRERDADSLQLIKVNALQVAPAELEDRLLENKDIADAAAAGVKVSDEEFPRAYVVLSDEAKKAKVTEKQIQDWFKTRVAKHKALVGGVKFVDEIVSTAFMVFANVANELSAQTTQRKDSAESLARMDETRRRGSRKIVQQGEAVDSAMPVYCMSDRASLSLHVLPRGNVSRAF